MLRRGGSKVTGRSGREHGRCADR